MRGSSGDVESGVAETKQNIFLFDANFATHSLNELVSGVIGCRAHRLSKNHRRPKVSGAKNSPVATGRGKKSGETMFGM